MSTPPTQELDFRRFDARDYATYRRWFADAAIRNALGHVDREWLDFVLSDDTGIEYAIFRGRELVAVLGLALPTAADPAYVIQNIAVHPAHFGTGIGTEVLHELYRRHPLGAGQVWRAYVDVRNTGASGFFARNGWSLVGREAGMLRLERR